MATTNNNKKQTIETELDDFNTFKDIYETKTFQKIWKGGWIVKGKVLRKGWPRIVYQSILIGLAIYLFWLIMQAMLFMTAFINYVRWGI